jgi:hypothetical protein
MRWSTSLAAPGIEDLQLRFKQRPIGIANGAEYALLLITFLSCAGAEQRSPGPPDNPDIVTVRLTNAVALHPFVRAHAEAAVKDLFLSAGVRIVFRVGAGDRRQVGRSVLVDLRTGTPPETHPRALGYALPFEGVHMVAFWDRIGPEWEESFRPVLLGYVIAHEIGHLLEWSDMHSATGIMKAHWSRADLAEMRSGKLHFTPPDMDFIHQGMAIQSPEYPISMAYVH